jgi:hypothetical protein
VQRTPNAFKKELSKYEDVIKEMNDNIFAIMVKMGIDRRERKV